MTQPSTFVKGRSGLLLLALAPLLLTVGVFMGSSGSSGSSSGPQYLDPATGEWESALDAVVLSENPAWEDLPGIGDGQAPVPTVEDVFSATALPGGSYHYEIAYTSGDRYQADLRPDGSANYRFDVHQSLASKVIRTVVLVLGLISVVLGLVSLLWNLTNADPRAKELAGEVNVSPLGRHLIERWLRRSRWFRFAGATVGVVVGIFGPSDISAMFVLAVAGTALGGALSELHLLRRGSGSTAVAGLTARRLSDYSEPRDTYAMGGLAVSSIVAVVLIATGVLAQGSLRLAMVALLVVVATRWFQHRVVSRARRAIRRELSSADDLLRYLAATQGFARPAIALAFFLMSASLSSDAAPDPVRGVSLGLALFGFAWLVIGRQSRIPRMAERASFS